MYILDTNICIYIIKKKPEEVLENLKKNYTKGVAISSVTVAELEYGIEKSQHKERNKVSLIEFLSIFQILPFDDRDAVEYGYLRASQEKLGEPIGPLDLIIASQAISRNLTLITNIQKEFSKIKNLKVENWVKKSDHR